MTAARFIEHQIFTKQIRPISRHLKGVCEFKDFYKGVVNLKKILILRPKFGK